ncbi:immunoglobulin superfamily member 23 isoform X2 [Tenrec ecaudatus]|uniref:immunoglobulin superfamily member 23 isoform X2 n=1 Tax=Tenrec ecaudatus TaxID=94439 RepID=UPI003F59B782
MILSPEVLSGPGHTGRELLGPRGDLAIQNVATQDSRKDAVLRETSRERRSAAGQSNVKATSFYIWVSAYPNPSLSVVNCELNYSVVLTCHTKNDTEVTWSLDGKPRGSFRNLIIRRLSLEDLGNYTCTTKDSNGQVFTDSVIVSMAEPENAQDPIEPDPVFSVSGSSAVGLIVAAFLGLVALLGGVIFTIIQKQRTDRRRIRLCC